jgi:DNA polymerase-3 subunit gamma/tau
MTEDGSSVLPQQTEDSDSAVYQVLARKYRPTTFSGLIGQDVLVRTLSNAFSSGRLAHAFILTGVRGIGKTTTARIIARALNCIGPDGNGEPTTEPCGQCEHCLAISKDRHVDVLEMDAASRTGVDDIRELIDGVRYRPTSARYKVYIIDEVHMLSKNAFNALLKTLEEPPEHVKFIFATTEIRKVPVTVLSRCQRFDLSRVDVETLSGHFGRIVDNEGAKIAEPALHLISRAADGSVRDGLSLLDQAISQTEGEIGEKTVREMLGLADRSQTFALLEAVLAGDIETTLTDFDRHYREGADPLAVFEDMLEIAHFLTRIKVVPSVADGITIPEIERTKGKEMAERLSMASLARTWQILLKGLGEVRMAPSPKQAAEMVLVRLAYTANLPTPDEAVKMVVDGGNTTSTSAPPASTPQQSAPPGPQSASSSGPTGNGGAATATAPVYEPEPTPDTAPVAQAAVQVVPQTFEEVLALADEQREAMLRTHLVSDVRIVNFEIGRIEFNPGPNAPRDLAGKLAGFLNEHTDTRWMVSVSSEAGQSTLHEKRLEENEALRTEAKALPLVKAVLETFPGATLEEVRKTSEADLPLLRNPDSLEEE